MEAGVLCPCAYFTSYHFCSVCLFVCIFITNKRNSFYLQLFLLCSRTHFFLLKSLFVPWHHFNVFLWLFYSQVKKFRERKSHDIFIFHWSGFCCLVSVNFSMLVVLIFYVFNIVFHYKERKRQNEPPLFIPCVCVCSFFSNTHFPFRTKLPHSLL